MATTKKKKTSVTLDVTEYQALCALRDDLVPSLIAENAKLVQRNIEMVAANRVYLENLTRAVVALGSLYEVVRKTGGYMEHEDQVTLRNARVVIEDHGWSGKE